jgi:photosystem II stability/assembly factor-like uncharacterized protein
VINEQNIWIAGLNGQLYHSKNGGSTWTSRQRSTGLDFSSIFFLNEQRGWLGSKSGQLLHTSDGGATWEPIDFGSEGNIPAFQSYITDIGFVDEMHGYVVFSGVILETKDGGKTWVQHGIEARRIAYLSESKLIVYNDDVKVYENNNWSTTFSFDQSPSIRFVAFKNAQKGYALSSAEQTPYWTNDGGYTWEPLAKVRLDEQLIQPKGYLCIDFNESGKAIAHFGLNNGNNFGYALPFVFNDGTNEIWTGPRRENVFGSTYHIELGNALNSCGSRAYKGNSVYMFFDQTMLKLSLQNI